MDPTVWGRGAWAIIFILIYKSIQKINSVDDREEYTYELENLKKKLYIICSTLPCDTCSKNALTHIKNNSIMACIDINIILHFFAELYNSFPSHELNKINRHTLTTVDITRF